MANHNRYQILRCCQIIWHYSQHIDNYQWHIHCLGFLKKVAQFLFDVKFYIVLALIPSAIVLLFFLLPHFLFNIT